MSKRKQNKQPKHRPAHRPRARRFFLWAGLATMGCVILGVTLWLLGSGGRSGKRPENVLLITIDTLRADRLGCYGYSAIETPAIDRLAREGLRFARAFAPAPFTLPSHCSIFTGVNPYRHGVRDNVGYVLGSEQRTLAEILKEHAFATAGFISAYVLDGAWGTSQGFDVYYDDFHRFEMNELRDAQRPGTIAIEQWEKWLERAPPSPHFAWIHLFEPHYPYAPPEPYRSRYADPYVGEVAYSDALIRRIVKELKDRRLLDETLIVLTSDHGESLGEHGEKTHSFFVYNATLRVPLILRGPGVPRGRLVEDPVSLIDIVPTVLALLGIKAPKDLEGRSLLKPLGSRRVYSETFFPYLHYGWSPLFAFQDGRFKVIAAPRPEVFDLDRDPEELTNLSSHPPQDARRLMKELHAVAEKARALHAPRTLGAEELERLAALGYTGTPSVRREPAQADPKDKIQVYEEIQEGWTLLRKGKAREALKLARELIAREPRVAETYFLAGRALFQEKNFPGAAETFRQALALDPEAAAYHHGLAQALERAGNANEAARAYRQVLEHVPTDRVALLRLGVLRFRAGDLEEAETLFRRLAEIDSESPHAETNLGNVFLARGELDAAEKHFRRALELDPSREDTHYNLGVVYQQRGQLDGAKREYRAEIRDHPDNVKAYHNLGLVCADAGDVDGQLEAFGFVVRRNPSSPAANYFLADALFQKGLTKDALKYAQRATGLDLTLEPAYLLLAAIHSQLGNRTEARKALARARALRAKR